LVWSPCPTNSKEIKQAEVAGQKGCVRRKEVLASLRSALLKYRTHPKNILTTTKTIKSEKKNEARATLMMMTKG